MGAVTRRPFLTALIVLATLALTFFLWLSHVRNGNGTGASTDAAADSGAIAASGAATTAERRPKNDSAETKLTTPPFAKTAPAKDAAEPSPSQKVEPILLTAANFESFVLRCFQGEPCRLADDPKKMYQEFKLAGDTKACDDLIAFLRRELLEPDLREQYKDLVKQLIDDFYPPDKREFQDAAYYAYVGDLQHSLDLYMDMDAKAKADPNLPPAPPLNVANVLYDMGKFKEALPYYEAALNEYNYGAQTLTPSTSEMMKSIQQRIDQIKAKL